MSDRDYNYRQHCLDSVKPLCLEAIATMRSFLDDAEREVNRSDATPERMIKTAMNQTAWGWANASGRLATAMSVLEDVRKCDEVKS